MKKLNNKGFVLAETLVVAVFLVTVFSIIYNNMMPVIGEYERREVYDDLDSKYAVYWLKTMVQDKDYNINYGTGLAANQNIMNNFDYSLEYNKEYEFNTANDVGSATTTHSYVKFDCNAFTGIGRTAKVKMCEETLDRLEVSRRNLDADPELEPEVYITAFKLTNFKNYVKTKENEFTSDFYDYLLFLPDYSKVRSTNLATARIIAKFHKTKDDNDYYTYAQIEVKK